MLLVITLATAVVAVVAQCENIFHIFECHFTTTKFIQIFSKLKRSEQKNGQVSLTRRTVCRSDATSMLSLHCTVRADC